jgi:hypothetical protein
MDAKFPLAVLPNAPLTDALLFLAVLPSPSPPMGFFPSLLTDE